MSDPLFALGLDFGTSGCRATVIDEAGAIVASTAVRGADSTRLDMTSEQDADDWIRSLEAVLSELWMLVRPEKIGAVAIDGTSGTVLACDRLGAPISAALMYDDKRATDEARWVAEIAPKDTATHGVSSSLSKILWLKRNQPGSQDATYLNQADWLAGTLTGEYGCTDENNALKMGYDPIASTWPDWLSAFELTKDSLPTVVPPGTKLGRVSEDATRHYGFHPATAVIAGTTDSIAASLASGVSQPGDAVTALGSTLVIKIVSPSPIFEPNFGVYSHKIGGRWLVGGASNSGGAVLSELFCPGEIQSLSEQLDPSVSSGLNYYPLFRPGERFPVNDPKLKPKLAPRPPSDLKFLHGVLEGIGRIEADGYRLLQSLGAPYPTKVVTNGGGAKNRAWGQIRARLLGVPESRAEYEEASYGAALIARDQTNLTLG